MRREARSRISSAAWIDGPGASGWARRVVGSVVVVTVGFELVMGESLIGSANSVPGDAKKRIFFFGGIQSHLNYALGQVSIFAPSTPTVTRPTAPLHCPYGSPPPLS